MELSKLWVYDLETFPNFFSMAIGNMESRKMKVFEISSRKDQRGEMFEYLRGIVRAKGYMVGFNCVGFDYPVLHYILENKQCNVIDIYQKVQSIIGNFDDRFGNIISDKKTMIPQIDLYKIHHFDNKARSTSLKMLEFNMRMDNIEELPYKPGTWLTEAQMDNLIRYNRHDVKATAMFLEKSMEQIDFRVDLSKKYKRNFLNFNDTKIGKDHFVTELEKSNPGCCYEMVGGKRKMRQTKRSSIDLGECIFPYVKFERPEFQAVLEWFKQQTISETKGVFTDILESDLGEVAKYARLTTKRQKQMTKPSESKLAELKKKHPMGWLSEEVLKSGKVSYWWNWNVADALNVVVDGLEYVCGTGGIHASLDSEITYSSSETKIIDVDVASMYPSLSIANGCYPEHLGEKFCDIYEGLFIQRRSHAKGTAENAMLKLALNGVYGASNDQYSPLYDPMFTMKITINGQLSLMMLSEQLLKVDGLRIIMANTDGVTFVCPADKEELAVKVYNEWEKTTGLILERADYKMMAQADVNSYIAVTTSGKIKTKGRYVYDGLGWHQNQSTLVIPMAAVKYLVDGTPIEDTILNHTDTYDFMARTKVPKSSSLVLTAEDGTEEQLQNTCRYYVSKTGGSMVKIMPPLEKGKVVWDCVDPEGNVERVDTKAKMQSRSKRGWKVVEVMLPPEPRRIGINAGQLVKPCNNMRDFKGMDDINYDWYIEQAEKLASLGSVDGSNEESGSD